MSLHYLVDGYNIVKQAPGLADRPLEQGRAGLLRWIDAHRPQGSANNRVTVVFDGKSEHFSTPVDCGVKTVFSRDESADDCIKAMVEKSAAKSTVVVVSDDKGIALYVRSLGAKVMGVKEFAPGLFASSSKPKPKGRSGAEKAEKYIPLVEQERINKEFEKLWGS